MRDYEELVKSLRNCAGVNSLSLYKRELMAQAADAIEELCKKREAACWGCQCEKLSPPWISVEERLPENGKPVNIVWLNRKPPPYYQVIMDKPLTATGIYFNGKWYWYSCVCEDYLREYGRWEPDAVDEGIQITHWMPLPEPPKED